MHWKLYNLKLMDLVNNINMHDTCEPRGQAPRHLLGEYRGRAAKPKEPFFISPKLDFFCLMLLTISFAKKRFNNRLPPCWCLSTVTCKEFPHWKSENLKNLWKKVKISLGKKTSQIVVPQEIACHISLLTKNSPLYLYIIHKP